ncbi:glycosyltransferase [Dactylosporangium sp. CA-092794]|uniref:glycosyltransferase n=1 Tax=Dactylosporangium sp. CA-092794 TaxID=3239929 RepID=UPI003D923D14
MRVSVIIPNYNKERSLAACLDAVHAQTLPAAEVIVVDDASTDGSREIIGRYPCRLLTTPVNGGVSAARNRGAAAAAGDVLFFVDSDVALAPGALEAAVRELREHPGCGVVQGIYDARPLFPGGAVQRYQTLSEHFWRRRAAGLADATLFALTAVRREAFAAVGGFDERLRDAEDVEWGTRLPDRWEIRMSAEVVGRHDHADGFGVYVTEQFRRARTYAGTVLDGRRAAPGPVRAARRRRGIDVPAVAAMTSCAAAVASLPLPALSPWFAALPALAVVAFLALDRRLLGFAAAGRGPVFAVFFAAMRFLTHVTEFAGMALGVLAALGRRWGRRLNQLFVAVFVVALAAGVVLFLDAQDWTPARTLAAGLGTGRVAAALGLAALINAAGLVLGLVSWRALFTDLGARVSGWTAARMFFVGFLTKFLPGRFLALPVLLRMGREVEVGPVRLAGLFMLSWSVVALTGLTVGIAAGPALAGGQFLWLLLAAVPVVALLVRPRLFNAAVAAALRVLRREPPAVAASDRGLRRALGAQTLSWIVSGHHLWLLAVVAGAPPLRSYLLCIGGFAAAATAGVLVMVAPDGLGVREAIVMVGLVTVLPVSVATSVVLASRLVCSLSEVIVGSGGLVTAEYMHRRGPVRVPDGAACLRSGPGLDYPA